MTNKEAIAYFKRHIDLYCVTGICREAEEMAIKALEQQLCENAISREQAIKTAIEAADDWDGGCNLTRADIIEKAIKALPPVTPQPKIGRWIDHPQGEQCSECGLYVIDHHNDNYCPNCGTKIE